MKTKLAKFIWLTAACLGFILLVAALLCLQPNDDIQKSLADTRQSLRAQGFKTDVADFDFSATGDLRARAEDIRSAGTSLPPALNNFELDLQPLADTESVAALWKLDHVKLRDSRITWQTFHDRIDPLAPILDSDTATIMAGPYRFNFDSPSGLHGSPALALPHLLPLSKTANALAARAMANLHDGDDAAAWTNLEAVAHLAIGWQVEPIEVSQLVRCNLANTAFATAWQALQKPDWSDAQLAALQQEWNTVDFFQGLPDTIAFQGAMGVDICQYARTEPITGGMVPGVYPGASRAPVAALAQIHDDWQEARYRGYGTYADEKNLLLYTRDRVVEARNALQATNWLQMEALPGITNQPEFNSPYPSRIQTLLHNSATSPAFRRLGGGLFTRAAVTETRRRLLITALALERFHLRHQAYPASLSDLTPDFLPAVPIDFMDGAPLRYHPTNDGHFLLYSVGLDGIDNGGTMKPVTSSSPRLAKGGLVGLFGAQDTDIVWPRPATDWQMKAMDEAAIGELLRETNSP